jgi:YbbR domain-containing protein
MRDWLTKDFGWKLFSVVLAVVILLTVRNVGVESGAPGLLAVQNIYTNIAVSAVSASADVRNVHVEPGIVSVTVSGTPDVMAALDSTRIHAVVNLTGIDLAHDLKCHVEVAVPPRVTLLSVDPPEVTVTISQK